MILLRTDRALNTRKSQPGGAGKALALLAASFMAMSPGAGGAENGTEPSAGPTTLSNLWSLNIRRNSDSTPAIGKDGTVYFGTFTGRLWAVGPEGKSHWVFDTKTVARSNMEIRSSPALAADGTIYFGCRDNRLYALTHEGELKWTFETGAWVDSSPALGVDGTVYVGSWDKNFYALTPEGKKKWQFATLGIIVSSPAVGAQGTVYFGSHDGKFYALKPDGAKAWDYEAGGQILSSPAIDGDGTLYFTSVNGYFHALNPDGSLRWKVKTGGMTESSPVIGQDGMIYVGVNNMILALSPDGKEAWQQQVMGGPIQELVQASPVALEGGGLYVLSRFGMLYRWDSERKPVERFYLYGSGYASPAVSGDGTVYMAGTWTNMHALAGSAKIAQSPWPKFRGSLANEGRAPSPEKIGAFARQR